MAVVSTDWLGRYVLDVAAMGGQPREGQVELIRVAVEEHGTNLVKAPTATGKTIGALYAAGLRAEQGQRTVISTFTKLLQDQYAGKDLAGVKAAFPGVKFGVLKGANNYVCGDALDSALKRGFKGEMRLQLLELNAAVQGMEYGEIPAGFDKIRPAVAADARFCKQHKPEECGFMAARARALETDVVITNHVLTILAAQFPKILGDHGLLIVDEIHNLPRAAESVGTVILDFEDIEIGLARAGLGDCISAVVDIGNRLPLPEEDSIVPLELLREMVAIWKANNLGKVLGNTQDLAGHLEPLRQLSDWIGESVTFYQKGIGAVSSIPAVRAKPFGKKVWTRRQVTLARVDLAPLCSLALSPLVGGPDGRDVVMMSATVGTPSHPTYVAERCGVKADLKVAKSPINYAKQMRLSVFKAGKPWPERILEMVQETGGRTLVLARSWQLVDKISDHLYSEWVGGNKVLRQNRQDPASNPGILAQFAEHETSVLVGTASFFEGIDVPGPSLSQVIICDLPIPLTLDPASQERRRRAGQNWKYGTMVPHTALVLEQMLGRLIRTPTDVGLAVILDDQASQYGGWGEVAVSQAAAALGMNAMGEYNTPRSAAVSWWKSQHQG